MLNAIGLIRRLELFLSGHIDPISPNKQADGSFVLLLIVCVYVALVSLIYVSLIDSNYFFIVTAEKMMKKRIMPPFAEGSDVIPSRAFTNAGAVGTRHPEFLCNYNTGAPTKF